MRLAYTPFALRIDSVHLMLRVLHSNTTDFHVPIVVYKHPPNREIGTYILYCCDNPCWHLSSVAKHARCTFAFPQKLTTHLFGFDGLQANAVQFLCNLGKLTNQFLLIPSFLLITIPAFFVKSITQNILHRLSQISACLASSTSLLFPVCIVE